MFSKKVISTILAMSMVASTSCLVSMIANTSVVSADCTSEEKPIEIKYSSVGSATAKNDSKVILDASYINDKYSNQKTAIVSLKGFIPSGRTIKKQDSYVATMKWPYQYKITVENFCDNNKVKIVDSLPNNAISTKEVNKSLSYTLGGGVDIGSTGLPTGSLNGSIGFTKSIQYTQPDYITLKTKDTTKKASWTIQFAETRDGYSVDSWNILYGNEMFLRTRYGNVSSEKNFLEDYKLSDLIVGGFSPNMGLVLKGEKGADGASKSLIRVTFKRVPNYYTIQWSTQWWGDNVGPYKNFEDPNDTASFLFELDWENYTVKPILGDKYKELK